jgi:hypothetical protein
MKRWDKTKIGKNKTGQAKTAQKTSKISKTGGKTKIGPDQEKNREEKTTIFVTAGSGEGA